MNNMPKIMKGHNKKVTLKPRDQRPKCNCRKKTKHQMERNSQINDVVYKCDLTRPWPKKVYLRLTEGEWNSRFYNSKSSFKHKKDIPLRQLSSYM